MTREYLNTRTITVFYAASAKKACPVDAISLTDHIEVDFDKCIGCGICAEKCPKHVVKIREEKAYICDTCKGDPKCIKTCPQNALTFE